MADVKRRGYDSPVDATRDWLHPDAPKVDRDGHTLVATRFVRLDGRTFDLEACVKADDERDAFKRLAEGAEEQRDAAIKRAEEAEKELRVVLGKCHSAQDEARAENEKLRERCAEYEENAQKEFNFAQRRNQELEKLRAELATVAERQRDACGRKVDEDILGTANGYSRAGDSCRATPLVTDAPSKQNLRAGVDITGRVIQPGDWLTSDYFAELDPGYWPKKVAKTDDRWVWFEGGMGIGASHPETGKHHLRIVAAPKAHGPVAVSGRAERGWGSTGVIDALSKPRRITVDLRGIAIWPVALSDIDPDAIAREIAAWDEPCADCDYKTGHEWGCSRAEPAPKSESMATCSYCDAPATLAERTSRQNPLRGCAKHPPPKPEELLREQPLGPDCPSCGLVEGHADGCHFQPAPAARSAVKLRDLLALYAFDDDEIAAIKNACKALEYAEDVVQIHRDASILLRTTRYAAISRAIENLAAALVEVSP